MKPARRRVEVNLEELDRVLDGARQAPLSEADYDKLKEALHTLAGMLAPPRNTEKTKSVLEESGGSVACAEMSRLATHLRRPDTDAMARKRLAVAAR